MGIASEDIPQPDAFDRAATWLDATCHRGCFATERGKIKNILHLQGACEIRAPPIEDKGHLLVAKSLRDHFNILTGEGWKVTVKYFTKTQSPSAMVGYTLKDLLQGWFNCVCKGLSQKDLAKARQDYMSLLKKSYSINKTTLDERGFMYEVFKFYASYLLPIRLTVCQVVRFVILSGLFALGNTWVYSAGDRSLDVNKIQCLWMIITDPDSTTIEMVSTILYGDQRAHRDGQENNLSSVKLHVEFEFQLEFYFHNSAKSPQMRDFA
jgi:hypothetical protein